MKFKISILLFSLVTVLSVQPNPVNARNVAPVSPSALHSRTSLGELLVLDHLFSESENEHSALGGYLMLHQLFHNTHLLGEETHDPHTHFSRAFMLEYLFNKNGKSIFSTFE